MTRNEILARAQHLFATRYASRISEEAGCLFWSAAFCEAMKVAGEKAALVAGSAQFRFRLHDDGVSDTHFSYMFEPAVAVERLVQGKLPEMHVWAQTEAGELVDLTTGYQRHQAARILGNVWDAELFPPPFLWCPVDDVPEQFIYQPHPVASKMAVGFLRTLSEAARPFRPFGSFRTS